MKPFDYLLATALLSSLLVFSPVAACGQTSEADMAEAKRIQARVLGVDSHNDSAQRILI